jgi:oxalate decarboxylase
VISRRDMLTATAAGAMASATARAGSFGNPDEPPQGAINAKNRESITDPGPQSQALASQFPSAQSPPATDVGDLPQFWASFNNAPRRIQNGGWARQVTQADFAISDTISGVNMRLTDILDIVAVVALDVADISRVEVQSHDNRGSSIPINEQCRRWRS